MELYVLDPLTLEPLGILEAYASVKWTRRLFEVGSLDLRFEATQAVPLVQRGRFLYVPETNHVYRLEQVHRIEDPDFEGETMEVQGRDVGGFFASRIVLPPEGASHDVQADTPAETALKHYADLHGGPGAALARRIPGLVIAPDTAEGPLITYEARFQTVAEVLADIGRTTGVGWDVVYDLETHAFTFEAIPGEDRTATVFVDVEFETSLGLEWLTSDLSKRNWGLVAGQGEGVLRAIEEVFIGAVEPEGFDRFELFIDANDIDDPASLADRGRAKLLETLTEDAFEVKVNPYGSFQYGRDYFLGDLVTVRSREWGIEAQAQVVGDETASQAGGASATTISMGRLFPTLRSRTRPPDNGSARK